MACDIYLHCPKCGSQSLVFPAGFHSSNGYNGVTCGSCGRPLTDEDVTVQGEQAINNVVDDMLNYDWMRE